MPKPTVKQIRKDLKLTQKKFMALCGIDDITTVYFSIWERGKGSMSMTHRAKIARATGYEIFEIDWIRFPPELAPRLSFRFRKVVSLRQLALWQTCLDFPNSLWTVSVDQRPSGGKSLKDNLYISFYALRLRLKYHILFFFLFGRLFVVFLLHQM